MMSRHFRLNSELSGAIAKRLLHAKNQHSAPSSFFNQFVPDINIYTTVEPAITATLYNGHLSITANFLQSLGWPLYTGSTVCIYIYIYIYSIYLHTHI